MQNITISRTPEGHFIIARDGSSHIVEREENLLVLLKQHIEMQTAYINSFHAGAMVEKENFKVFFPDPPKREETPNC